MRSPGAFPHHRGLIAVLLGVAAFITALLLASSAPERASAAPCQAPIYTLLGGNLGISGSTPCDSEPEGFRVFCSAGTVVFEYRVNGTLVGNINTGVACGAPTRLTMIGNSGGDTIDLSAVTSGAGFTGVSQPNMLDGAYGGDILIGSGFPDTVLGGPDSDILLLRDGIADTADCGDGIDAAQADRASLDSLSACEIADVLPEPPRKCKKKKKAGRGAVAAKKCRKPKKR